MFSTFSSASMSVEPQQEELILEVQLEWVGLHLTYESIQVVPIN